MKLTVDIFSEYTSMRRNGLDIGMVREQLHPYIKPLSIEKKQKLAKSMRNWENKNKQEGASSRRSRIRPLKSVSTIGVASKQTIDWIACPHCGQRNQSNSTLCLACGLKLKVSRNTSTKEFTGQSKTSHQFFGMESVLVLKVATTAYEYEILPQMSSQEIFIGRSSPNSVIIPDIDFIDVDAELHGVSRLHMGIKYDPNAQVLQISDLDSANGSFINEQKLHPKEIVVLQNGDKVRLGRLIIRTEFRHPGNEI
jgi:hypothetical protein